MTFVDQAITAVVSVTERTTGPAVSTMRLVRVLPHIEPLDDCFGDFLVRVTCPCGASRHIAPEALARIH